MNVKVSIIVPVYNAEQYLQMCIDSLINQTLKEIEFIFVDDGSTDNSLNILKQYQSHDERIHVITQEKSDAGSARNRGMDEAKGKYLMFIDSDDFFKHNLISSVYQMAEKHQAQIVVFEYYSYNESYRKIEKRHIGSFPKNIFRIEDLGGYAFQICKAMPWNKLFLKQFVVDNGIRFQSIKRCNDKVFVFTALACAEKICHLNNRLVFYRYNNPTSLQGSRDKSREDYIYSLLALKNELESKNLYNGALREIFQNYSCYELKSGMRAPFSIQSIKSYYKCAKKYLVPGLFDQKDDFLNEQTLINICDSNSFEEFIVREYQNQLLTSVSKTSIEYKIGSAFLRIPRKIW